MARLTEPATAERDASAALAEARARAYALLADLLARGPVAELLEAAAQSPGLALALGEYDDPDELAVDHQHVFGFALSLQEGALLERDGRAGGAASADLVELYRELGFAWDPTGPDPEHLAVQLQALAHLSGAEADARVDGRRDVVEKLERHGRTLLDEHVLRFLPVLVGATHRIGRTFPAALMSQIEALAIIHRDAIGAPWPVGTLLPDADLSLDDPDVGLRGIGEMLARPARSGVLWSRDDLERAARVAKVPRGFGDRTIVLKNALESAAHLGAMPELVDALEHVIEHQAQQLGDPRYAELPWLATLTEPWVKRSTATLAVLSRIRAGVE